MNFILTYEYIFMYCTKKLPINDKRILDYTLAMTVRINVTIFLLYVALFTLSRRNEKETYLLNLLLQHEHITQKKNKKTFYSTSKKIFIQLIHWEYTNYSILHKIFLSLMY